MFDVLAWFSSSACFGATVGVGVQPFGFGWLGVVPNWSFFVLVGVIFLASKIFLCPWLVLYFLFVCYSCTPC
jgi:hypothetical protein